MGWICSSAIRLAAERLAAALLWRQKVQMANASVSELAAGERRRAAKRTRRGGNVGTCVKT